VVAEGTAAQLRDKSGQNTLTGAFLHFARAGKAAFGGALPGFRFVFQISQLALQIRESGLARIGISGGRCRISKPRPEREQLACHAALLVLLVAFPGKSLLNRLRVPQESRFLLELRCIFETLEVAFP
jgi:hypothetical protein